ncbi:ArnT family glycosyltransferase [Rubinisphaera margarita]|uniref:ArnT family glycosyltransferase n=1 Tax=Rubinisphaera margarita TaxID=2909586 RepID=UPI001EE7B3AD|nr:glycosyltransferase family 39 protein [Rubinisphaera margarita]MCG6158591.1 glycosyltransferase family 39 protein [Rubinisphaera margarita]
MSAACPVLAVHPISRRELLFVVGITLLGAVLRLWDLSAIAVEHFDEGVYASNLWFTAEEGYRYPDRHLYAPPLLPTLIEWSLLIFGTASWVPALPSLGAGVCTIPLIWWMGRKLAGPTGGLAAAMLLAANDVHILYSRTALTEAMLCFCMLLSVSLAHCTFLELKSPPVFSKRSISLAMLSGLMAGLAWLTKYNGWLSLAIIYSGSLAWAVFGRFSLAQWTWLIAHYALIGGVAAAVWLPYVFSLDEFGGYAAVAANHRQYFGGLAEWGPALARQISNQWQLSGWTTLVGVVGVGVLIGSRLMLHLDSLQFRWSRSGAWMAASWVIGLSVAIPLYHPYPRLVVPWWVGVLLVLGAVSAWLQIRVEHYGKALPARAASIALLVLGVVAFAGPVLKSPAWERRKELQIVAEDFVAITASRARDAGLPENEVIFYVYGEPAIFYHISLFDRLAGPIGHLDFAKPETRLSNAPTYLVVGPHAEESQLFTEQWEALGSWFEPVHAAKVRPSRLVQLNNVEPEVGESLDEYALYQLKPAR